MNSTAGPLAVVAHDAGAAEILASFVEEQIPDARFVLAGPAARIFRQRLGEIETVSLQEALTACDWVLTGTSSQTDLEWCAIREGRLAGKHVVTFLDHWMNYSSRFVRHGTTCYPDEIWVGDSYALQLASKTFPSLAVRQVGNPYFSYFVKEVARLERIAALKRSARKNFLYVSENIHRDGFNQDDAIRYFMDNLGSFKVEIGQVLIRPHPSESVNKYAWVADEFRGDIRLSGGASLAEEVAVSDVVVGCSSMAMALAVMAGRRVISCIPNEEIPLTLPFEQIEQLSTIIKCSNESAY